MFQSYLSTALLPELLPDLMSPPHPSQLLIFLFSFFFKKPTVCPYYVVHVVIGVDCPLEGGQPSRSHNLREN